MTPNPSTKPETSTPFFPDASAEALIFFDRTGMLREPDGERGDRTPLQRLAAQVVGARCLQPPSGVRPRVLTPPALRLLHAAGWLWHYQRALAASPDLKTLEALARIVAREWRWVAASNRSQSALQAVARTLDVDPGLVVPLRAAITRELLPVLTLQRAMSCPKSAQAVLRGFKLPTDVDPSVVELFAQCLPFLNDGPEEPLALVLANVVVALARTTAEDARQFLVSQCTLALKRWTNLRRSRKQTTAPLHEHYQPIVTLAGLVDNLDLCHFRSVFTTSSIILGAPVYVAAMAGNALATVRGLAQRLASARALHPANPRLTHCTKEVFEPLLRQLRSRVADPSTQFALEVDKEIARITTLVAELPDPLVRLHERAERAAASFAPRRWDEPRGQQFLRTLRRTVGGPTSGEQRWLPRILPSSRTVARLASAAAAVVLLTGAVAAGLRALHDHQFVYHYEAMIAGFDAGDDAALLTHASGVLAHAPPEAPLHREQASRLRDAALVRMFVAHVERGEAEAAAELIALHSDLEEDR